MEKANIVWHCPRPSCGAIVLKTEKPFLTDGMFRCRRCNTDISYKNLMKGNPNNLKRMDIFCQN